MNFDLPVNFKNDVIFGKDIVIKSHVLFLIQQLKTFSKIQIEYPGHLIDKKITESYYFIFIPNAPVEDSFGRKALL